MRWAGPAQLSPAGALRTGEVVRLRDWKCRLGPEGKVHREQWVGQERVYAVRLVRVAAHALLGIVVLGWLQAEGATIRVPGDASSVLDGVDLASPGDTVLVGPGVWSDREARQVVINNVLRVRYSTAFLTPGVHLISESGPEATVLDGGAVSDHLIATVIVVGDGGESSLVEGFAVTGGGFGRLVSWGTLSESF